MNELKKLAAEMRRNLRPSGGKTEAWADRLDALAGAEPVGQLVDDIRGRSYVLWFRKPEVGTLLYAAPQPREPTTRESLRKVIRARCIAMNEPDALWADGFQDAVENTLRSLGIEVRP